MLGVFYLAGGSREFLVVRKGHLQSRNRCSVLDICLGKTSISTEINGGYLRIGLVVKFDIWKSFMIHLVELRIAMLKHR